LSYGAAKRCTGVSTNDLQALAPLLLDASFRHFGETTSATVTHTFGEEEVKKLRERQSGK
jgi:hypothetical protein